MTILSLRHSLQKYHITLWFFFLPPLIRRPVSNLNLSVSNVPTLFVFSAGEQNVCASLCVSAYTHPEGRPLWQSLKRQSWPDRSWPGTRPASGSSPWWQTASACLESGTRCPPAGRPPAPWSSLAGPPGSGSALRGEMEVDNSEKLAEVLRMHCC